MEPNQTRQAWGQTRQAQLPLAWSSHHAGASVTFKCSNHQHQHFTLPKLFDLSTAIASFSLLIL